MPAPNGGRRQLQRDTQQPDITRQMKRWLKILMLALGMVITAQAQALAGSRTCSDGPDDRDDRQQAEWTIGKERCQAVLTNANELVRLCSQRPERLLSSPDYVPVHHSVSRPQYLFTHQKAQFCHYRGLFTGLTRPLLDMPQSDYYVYRLRHLLC